MKTITIRELHLATGRWVREAARTRRIVVTDRRRPIAVLGALETGVRGRPLPDREARIRRRSRLRIDSSTLLSGMRDRT